MNKLSQYQVGVNLGGWISQYQEYDHAHFQTFITESDIQQIASWGMDHVRLPFDYPVLESDDAPGTYLERGFNYIDNCINWCQKAGLGLVLDLHHAPGYSFTNTLEPETEHLNTLFTEESSMQRFIDLWEAITKRYVDAGNDVIFELLNEMKLPESSPWNKLAARTVAAIRKIDPDRAIILGGNNYNDVTELENLVYIDDPQVYYTFHFYRPMMFTHQKAYWFAAGRTFDQTLDYPGPFTNLDEFVAAHPEYAPGFEWQIDREMNIDLLREFLKPAAAFMEKNNCFLYCGEFGVIDRAPQDSSVRWHADFIALLREMGISRAVWSYKLMDFGLVDGNGRVVNEDLIKIVSAK